MGEPVLLREMAADMIRLSGFDQSEVPIVFTELRPGEKLNEILWEEDAVIESTARGDIRRVRESAFADDDRLDDIIAQFADAAARNDHGRITRLFNEHIYSASVTTRPRDAAARASAVVIKLPGG
jgi:FlaA1/EpsC-like NDP-sugar epimerase